MRRVYVPALASVVALLALLPAGAQPTPGPGPNPGPGTLPVKHCRGYCNGELIVSKDCPSDKVCCISIDCLNRRGSVACCDFDWNCKVETDPSTGQEIMTCNGTQNPQDPR